MQRGLTLVEVLVVVFFVVILIGLLPNRHPGTRAKAERIACVNNLRQIGLAFRAFATDHGGKYPTDLSVTNSGSREWLADETRLWRHFLVVSNRVETPKLLLCPEDKERLPVKSFWKSDPRPPTWSQLTSNSQLSYFLGPEARDEQPQSIWMGDRNLSCGTNPVAPGRLVVTPEAGSPFASDRKYALGFTAQMHNQAGNIMLGDGSVQQVTSGRLRDFVRDALTSEGVRTNLWLVP